MTWTERRTRIFDLADLPFETDGIVLLNPSSLVVRFPNCSAPIDLGVLCYSKRRRNHSTRNHGGYGHWQVKLESYRKERPSIVIKFSEFLFAKYRLGSRPATVNSYRTKFIQFVDWCDQQYPQVFASNGTMVNAVKRYTDHLFEQVRLSKLSINTAAHVQSGVVEVIGFICDAGSEDILSGTRTIRRKSASIRSTEPPEYDDAANALGVLECVFCQFSAFVLQPNTFPFIFELPNESLWVFPTNVMVAPHSSDFRQNTKKRGFWAYDFENGRLATEDEIVGRYKGSARARKSNARLLLRKAERQLSDANTDCRHWARIRLATLACQAFTMLFIANTGMNLSSAISLRWNDDHFRTTKANHTFKTVKYRANGKEVTFRIGAHFVKHFRKYLRLRRWLLPTEYDRLFFRLDGEQLSPINNAFSSALFTRLSRMFGPMAKISASQWRAAKSEYVVRHTDIQTAAELLQNSEDTVVRAYATGTRSGADAEMTAFFKSGFDRLVESGDKKIKPLMSGHCKNIGSPTNDESQSFWQPDCRSSEGCLFCVHFCVHTDEVDIRKLLSLRYVLVQSRVLAFSRDHYHAVYGGVLNRIDEILQSLADYSDRLAATVTHVRSEIDEEERLSPYWAKKLKLLVDLGVLV